MGAILRASGISMILGTLLLVIGSFGSLQHALLWSTSDVPHISPGGFRWATWAGITLMALGLIAVLTVLFVFVRRSLRTKVYYEDESWRSSKTDSPGDGQQDSGPE